MRAPAATASADRLPASNLSPPEPNRRWQLISSHPVACMPTTVCTWAGAASFTTLVSHQQAHTCVLHQADAKAAKGAGHRRTSGQFVGASRTQGENAGARDAAGEGWRFFLKWSRAFGG